MAKLKGTVGHSDLEGGYLTLEADDGKRYKLEGDDAALKALKSVKAGVKVEIEGSVEEGGFGLGFGAPVLTVKKHKAL